MNGNQRYAPRCAQSVALWLCLVLPSIFSVQKYFGWPGVVAYFIFTAAAIWAMPRLRWNGGERRALWLCLVTLALLGVIFAVGYPIANAHIADFGSDDDDALNLAVNELLHGRFPYYTSTYLGNFVHHLPGAFVLALPFVLIGTSPLQNLFWLALFLLVLRRELADTFAALRWFWLMLIFSPIALHQLITGTGHVTNAIYVLLGLWWLVTAKRKAFPAAAWGVALSSRPNFLLLIPLACGWLVQRFGWNIALRTLLVTCIVFTLLTVPFYLYDPRGFSPLETVDRLTQFNAVLPYAGTIIGLGMGLASVMLSWLPMKTSAVLWFNCAVVLSVPVIAGYLLGRELAFLVYGAFFLPFGVLAAATLEAITPKTGGDPAAGHLG